MNDQIPNTDEKRAVERWENEGGKVFDRNERRKHRTISAPSKQTKGLVQ